jgi:hypothetical protein
MLLYRHAKAFPGLLPMPPAIRAFRARSPVEMKQKSPISVEVFLPDGLYTLSGG